MERAAELLESNYVYPDRGRKLGKQLRREARAAWVSAGTPEEFAKSFTEKLRGLSADGHFHVDFRQDGADATEETAFGAAEFEKYYGKAVNHGFEQVSRLDGNIGYLDLRVFAPPGMGADMAAAAMTLLAQTSALIIDLRRNGGGDGALGLFIAGYLLDGATADERRLRSPQRQAHALDDTGVGAGPSLWRRQSRLCADLEADIFGGRGLCLRPAGAQARDGHR